MAEVALTQVTDMMTLVGATNITSADSVFSISANALRDEDINLVFVNGANSSLVVALQRGEYANGDSSLSGTDADTLTTVAASTTRVITGLDGSKYRKTDGTFDATLALTGSGSCNIYAFTKKIGV